MRDTRILYLLGPFDSAVRSRMRYKVWRTSESEHQRFKPLLIPFIEFEWTMAASASFRLRLAALARAILLAVEAAGLLAAEVIRPPLPYFPSHTAEIEAVAKR